MKRRRGYSHRLVQELREPVQGTLSGEREKRQRSEHGTAVFRTLFCCPGYQRRKEENWRLPWGSRTVKTVPSASLLATEICPLWDWTMALAMASPRP